MQVILRSSDNPKIRQFHEGWTPNLRTRYSQNRRSSERVIIYSNEDPMQRYFTSLAAIMATAMAAEIPIRQVVLYKSGVGYFARAGELKPGESARLDFKASEMDDVLKSLTIEDKSGTKISGLRYDSSEPLAGKLAEFPFQVAGHQSLSAFLDQVKGTRVELKYGAETVSGTVVSGRMLAASDKAPEREQVVLLMDTGELRTFDLAAASSIRFSDPKLQLQLRDYLGAVNQSRSKDKRSVYIDSSDVKGRQIVASYMSPTPVWKSSYRLIFGHQGEPTLEGWAIVDNLTGEDWTNIKLSVVSGRPVSFISRLYEPKFLQRPTVDLPEDRAQGPVLHEGGVDQSERLQQFARMQKAPAPPLAMRSMMPSAGLGGGVIGGVLGDAAETRLEIQSSLGATAEGRDLGDLFEYSFAPPITVKKNESAMLPFVQQKLGARKLLIYSESYGQNPMSAAELTNSTGKTLDGGPLTVFDSGNYSGEALMETLRPSDKRLISYAVDLGTRITTKFDSTRDLVREIHANRGIVTTRIAMQETRTYTVRNVDAKPKTLIIEHAQRPGYTLLSAKPAETTASAYRFEVKLQPSAVEKFPVSEERIYDNTTAVLGMTPDALAAFIQNKALPQSAQRQLQEIADLKRQIADNDQRLHQTEADMNDVIRDQDRIRQNIGSLNNVSGQQDQVQKYSRQLADQETKLASLRDAASEFRKKKTALESSLNGMIEKLAF